MHPNHFERFAEDGYSLPAQLGVIEASSSDEMEVAIVEARDHRAPGEIDDLSVGTLQGTHLFIASDLSDHSFTDRGG